MILAMNIALPTRLTVDEFVAWAVRQKKGKYELVDGVIIEEPRQNWGHTKTRMQALVALREAIDWGQSTFYVAPNGPTVRVNEHTAFTPDALVAPLPEPAFDSLEITNPIIGVEVLSPSTVRMDTTTKLDGYLRVASVKHYLIADPEARTVTHHKRGRAAAMKTRIVRKGVLALNPPGIAIRPSDLFAPAT
jgi:Uma2 family endonuclease